MASLFGITSAKYQYAIDEYYRMKKEVCRRTYCDSVFINQLMVFIFCIPELAGGRERRKPLVRRSRTNVRPAEMSGRRTRASR